MGRPLRIQYPGAWYHVMNRGASHQGIFFDDEDRKDFLKLLGETSKMWRIQVHAFCLLDNHYHLLIHTPLGNLSRSMRYVNGIYTQRFNRRHGNDGPIFRGRFKAILIDADSYLLEVVRYIHLNPVKAKIVRNPEQYPWSSHHAYLNKLQSINWLVRDEVLDRFGKRWNHTINRYKEFIQGGIPSDIDEFYNKKKTAFILGSERFKEWIRNKSRKTVKENYEIPEAKGLYFNLSVGRVIDIVRKSYGVDLETLTRLHRGKWNEPRDIAIYLCRKECGLTLKEIGSKFEIPVYTTISMSLRRVEKMILKNKSLQKRLNKITKRLQS